jgi:hypothetical protein
MNHIALLRRAYRALGETTPIFEDCGQLCGQACCIDIPDEETGGDGKGMLLLPGEAELLSYTGYAKLSRIELKGAFARPVWFMTCRGQCPRRLRPMACRLFPLIPYVAPDDRQKDIPPFSIVGDPRGVALCPLAQTGYRHVEPAFYMTVERAVSILWESKAMRSYFISLSALLDDYFRFL